MPAIRVPGPGGQASITGNVSGIILENSGSNPSAEVTTITCTPGSVIDDNDYWIINAASGNQYYIWYDISNWIGGDPALSGRIGIKVDYNFSQNNATIATNTSNAITSIANSDFTVSLNNDVITLSGTSTGQVPDAEDMNSPMAVDVQYQGSGGTSGSSPGGQSPIVDERVYIIYGDDEYYSDIVRTDEKANYRFNYLEKGSYKIYAFSVDTLSAIGLEIKVEVPAEINDKKEAVEAPQIVVVK